MAIVAGNDVFPGEEEVSRFFGTLVAVALAAAILAGWFAEQGTKKWKHTFCTLLFVAAIAVETYFLALVGMKLPPGQQRIWRSCANGIKGGKQSGHLRDCMQGEGSFCTLKEPCTPCDEPMGHIEFDSLLWPSTCRACSNLNPGVCRASEGFSIQRNSERKDEIEWCRNADGTVEPCARCCLSLHNEAKSMNFYTANNCEFVRDATWMRESHGLLSCPDPEYALVTRFGCCPTPENLEEGLSQYTSNEIALGDGLLVPACSFWGPKNDSWAFCTQFPRREPEFLTIKVNNTLSLPVPRGCPLYSNGKPRGVSFCKKPNFNW